MGTVRRFSFIECDADTVWAFVGAPERLHEWFPITSCRVEGNKRWIELAAGITFEEDIVTLDHPLITFHLGTVDVIPDGPNRCLLMYSTDMEPEVLALPIGGAAGVGIAKVKEMFDRK
jgi:hypothetical protein